MVTVPGEQSEHESMPPVDISAICGSLSEQNATKMALNVALRGASEFRANTRLIELRNYELVFFGKVAEEEYPPDVFRLREEIKDSQGIILGTPEYYGSLSGVLKNMFDLMRPEEFEGKIVGLIGVAGGHTGAINSLNAMRTIGRNLHCWVLPQEVSIADSKKVFDEDGTVTDPAAEERLLDIGRQVVKLATVQRRIKQDDFMTLWEGLLTW